MSICTTASKRARSTSSHTARSRRGIGSWRSLRTSWLCQAPYEFGEHVRLATSLRCVNSEEVSCVVEGSTAAAWGEHDRAVLDAAEDLHGGAMIADDTWDQLARTYDDTQLIELPMAVGQATMVAYFQNACRFRLAPANDGLRARRRVALHRRSIAAGARSRHGGAAWVARTFRLDLLSFSGWMCSEVAVTGWGRCVAGLSERVTMVSRLREAQRRTRWGDAVDLWRQNTLVRETDRTRRDAFQRSTTSSRASSRSSSW